VYGRPGDHHDDVRLRIPEREFADAALVETGDPGVRREIDRPADLRSP